MKFIDKTIKYLLLALGLIVSSMIVVHILFVHCKTDTLSLITKCHSPAGWFALFGILLALSVGALFAYVLVRVIFWPHGPRSKATYLIVWVMAGIGGAFIALLTFGAFAIGTWGI